MKKLLAVLVMVMFLAACSVASAPVSNGFIFTSVKGPVAATETATFSKKGEASCSTVLGLISTGDASIKAAMRDGGITKIHHVDHSSTTVLGLYAKFTTVVYGE